MVRQPSENERKTDYPSSHLEQKHLGGSTRVNKRIKLKRTMIKHILLFTPSHPFFVESHLT